MTTKEEIKKTYQESKVFKEYVDAFAFSRRKSVSDILETEIVEEVFKMYKANKTV